MSFAASHPGRALIGPTRWLNLVWLIRLAVASLAVAAAFSAAQAPAASDAVPAAEGGVRRPPANPPVEIAIVLPLDAPPYARAAEAVRAGFTAAAEASGGRTPFLVIPHAEDGVLGAFESARKSGAKVIVGPLTRDDLKTVAQANLDLPWTLALNQQEDSLSGPIQLFTFSLTVESDARTIARRMHEDAAQNVVIVGGDTPLMKRFAGAFATEWLLEGGGAPNSFHFDPAPEALTLLKRELTRKPPDAALLGVNGVDVPLVKPFLGTVTAYASGLVFDRKSAATLRDLDGLVIVEIPWLVSPAAPEYAAIARREFASESLERLYALGGAGAVPRRTTRGARWRALKRMSGRRERLRGRARKRWPRIFSWRRAWPS